MVTRRSLLGAICGGWLSFLLCGPKAALSRHNIVIDEESMGKDICNWMDERDAHIQAVKRGRYQRRLIDATVIALLKPVHPLWIWGIALRLQVVVPVQVSV